MATTVTVSTSAASAVTIRPSKTTVASVVVAPSSNISLGSLTNVDIADVANGEALIYNSANGKFEGGTVTSVVTSIVGGSF
jgi:cytosine/adenosine deaminase-related metal-dependent hydrolase